MPFTMPSNNVATGHSGFYADQNGTSDALAALGAGNNPLNAVFAGGADPTGVADSTAAIQATVNTGYCRIPSGTYKLSATLSPTAAVTVIEGTGWGTILQWDGTAVSPFIGMADTTQRTVILRNLRLANSGASAAGLAVNADYFTSQSVISGVKIDGISFHPNQGVAYGAASTNTHYCTLENCRIQVDGTGAKGVQYLGGATGAISNVFRNNRILISASDASQTGVVVATRGILLDHPDIEGGAGTGVDIQSGGDACTMISPYLESNGTNVRFASGVVSPVIIGGTILTGTTADITDNGAVGPVILGVRTTGGAGVPYSRAVLQQNAAAGKIAYIINTAATPSDAALRVDVVSGQQALAVRNTGDGASRWRITGSGAHDFGDGTSAPDCHLSRQGAGVMQFTGCDLDIATAGNGLRVKEGSNAKMGTAVLNGTTGVTVATTAVTAASRVYLTHQAINGVPGVPYVSGRSAGTSFTVVSTAVTDLGTVAWLLVEPG
jgi:hypothetical protein